MLQNLKIIANFQQIQLDNLVDFEKCCKTHIFLQRSVLIQPKTSKFCRNFADRPRTGSYSRRPSRPRPPRRAWPRRRSRQRLAARSRRRPLFAGAQKSFANFCKFLAGSFSAVSKRKFATKYAFDSIFQVLQDLHLFAPLQSQNFRKKAV